MHWTTLEGLTPVERKPSSRFPTVRVDQKARNILRQTNTRHKYLEWLPLSPAVQIKRTCMDVILVVAVATCESQ